MESFQLWGVDADGVKSLRQRRQAGKERANRSGVENGMNWCSVCIKKAEIERISQIK